MIDPMSALAGVLVIGVILSTVLLIRWVMDPAPANGRARGVGEADL